MNSKITVKHPIGIQWKIAEARLQEKRNSINGYFDSTAFNISADVTYFIRIYPNGMNKERPGETNICYYIYFYKNKEVKAEFTISIETADFIQKIEHVFTKPGVWTPTCCKIDKLFDPEKRFIVNGEMVIKVKGFFTIEKDAPKESYNLGESVNTLGIDLWNQDNKDFTIVADEKEIQVHKFVLSTRSPVFAAMFQPHTQEAQENRVVIPDFPFHIVETGIKLCYDPKLVQNIPLEDQMSLLQFFDKYDIQSFKIDLENYMISVMDESNVCRLANCAINSNSLNLLEKCGELLEKCFREQKLLNDLDILEDRFVVKVFKNSLLKVAL